MNGKDNGIGIISNIIWIGNITNGRITARGVSIGIIREGSRITVGTTAGGGIREGSRITIGITAGGRIREDSNSRITTVGRIREDSNSRITVGKITVGRSPQKDNLPLEVQDIRYMFPKKIWQVRLTFVMNEDQGVISISSSIRHGNLHQSS
jgi:hypothetical protein